MSSDQPTSGNGPSQLHKRGTAPTAVADIPTPSWRLPLLGDVLRLDPVRPTQREMEMAKELGPIFEIDIAGKKLVVVAGADEAAEVFDEKRFAKAIVPPITKLRDIASDGLFTAYNSEPNWEKAHNILAPAFSQASMRSYHDTMVSCVEDLCTYWDSKVTEAPVDVAGDMNKLTLEVIGRTGFDHTFHSFDSTEDPFVTAMVRGMEFISQTSNDIPIIREIFGRKAAAQKEKDVRYLRKTVDEIIAARKAPGAERHNDLLQRMLETPDPDTGEYLSDENIRNQVLTFLVAGHETTASTLSFALYFLSQHPEVAERARAEVDELWADPADTSSVAFEQAARLRYVRRIIEETLRLWPAGPAFFRKPREDTLIGEKYLVKKGHPILVLLLSLHRDPAWGEDPEAFDPDRFERAAMKERPAHIYKPFGTGARACIGRQFAFHEAVLALATLIRRFDFTADPGYELKVKELLTIKPEGFRLTLKHR